MAWVLIAVLAWFLLAIVVAFVIAGAVRMADDQAHRSGIDDADRLRTCEEIPRADSPRRTSVPRPRHPTGGGGSRTRAG